jgi:hypothetical protein
MTASVFAAVAASMYAAHHAGDYWVQTRWQAATKGVPGWPGRKACAAHVATHTATLGVFLAAAWLWLGLPLHLGWVFAGLGIEAVSHYVADRRRPLERLANYVGHIEFYRSGGGFATGAALLDQAWHWTWMFAAALIITGGPHG